MFVSTTSEALRHIYTNYFEHMMTGTLKLYFIRKRSATTHSSPDTWYHWIEGAMFLTILFILATYLTFFALLLTLGIVMSTLGFLQFLVRTFAHRPVFLLPYEHRKEDGHQNMVFPPNEELQPTIQKLKELDAFKQQMVRMLVHDLKTPLSNIMGLSENGVEGSDKQRIYQASKQMLDLTMNMLDVQKMEEAALQLNASAQNSQHLLQQAVAQFSGSNCAVKISPRCITANVEADRQLIERVLMNLLSNAVKYSPQNGEVMIEVEKIGKNLKFSVIDQGIGIPIKVQDKIFDKFYQVQQQPKFAYSTGLGLTFCKLVIEAHGGKIGVTSTEQQGSTFWFTLPLSDQKRMSLQTCNMQASVSSHTRFQSTMFPLHLNDKKALEPWLKQLRQYEVFQLTKIKAVLKTMTFHRDSTCYCWKRNLEKALYSSNQEQYQRLIS